MHQTAHAEKRLELPTSPVSSLTELQLDEERLHLLKEAIDCLPISTGITISDADGRIIYMNEADSRMHGWEPGELIGRDARILAPPAKGTPPPRVHHEDLGFYKRECVNVTKQGAEFPVELTSIPIRTESGAWIGVVTACEDITRRKDCERRIEHLAYYDTTTHLPNRTLLMDRLHQALALARREKRRLALLFLDLDNFKDLNNARGHEFGDKFLMEVARRLSSVVCGSNTLGRLGGDEFVVVLNSVREGEGAAATAERVQALFERPFVIDGEEFYGSTSIGIALYPDDGPDVESLFRCADAAVYQAKSEGKGGYQFFSRDMNLKNMRRMALENGMRQGLSRGEFFLEYQPQWELRTGRLTGAEALVRWESAEFGRVGPDEFIPIAEASGLIFELGETVLREACLFAAARGSSDLKIAVNISGRQFRQPDFLGTVARIMAETEVPPASLELELTESVIMERAEKNIDALQALKGMGVQLSIDDFGTGYSSLNYLKHFPIDSIKIDRSFIAELGNGDDAAIAEAMICMAHSLKLKVVAEGVEDSTQLEFLVQRCCDEAQGYYLARPMTADAFSRFLSERE